MKTKQILAIGLLGLTFSFMNAQNVQSNTLATSGGLEAGTTASGTGGNAFYGYQAGKINTSSGVNNTFIGHQSGLNNTSGQSNTYVGNNSGGNGGNANISLGYQAGVSDGNNNIFIGNKSGAEDSGTGDGNIYIGHNAGFANTDYGNRLIIDNGLYPQETTTPLIWGDFANDLLKFHGKIGIGGGGSSDIQFGNFPTTSGTVSVSNYRLFVKGGILTEEVRVSLSSTWADYVFQKDYKLPTLKEVENHITQKGHLINVPSAKEVGENGIELGEMAKIQQEKIEELTLYIIEQNKINEKQNEQIEKQSKEIEELKVLVKNLIEKNK